MGKMLYPKNPLYHAFYSQRSLARRRGVVWKLEYDEWLQIWQESGHLHERGNRRGYYVMARNHDHGPYARGNVSIVLFEINSRDGALNKNQILTERFSFYRRVFPLAAHHR